LRLWPDVIWPQPRRIGLWELDTGKLMIGHAGKGSICSRPGQNVRRPVLEGLGHIHEKGGALKYFCNTKATAPRNRGWVPGSEGNIRV